MDCSLPGSSVHGILQARILEWVANSFSRGSSRPRNRTQVSCMGGRFSTGWATREATIPCKVEVKYHICHTDNQLCQHHWLKFHPFPSDLQCLLNHKSSSLCVEVWSRLTSPLLFICPIVKLIISELMLNCPHYYSFTTLLDAWLRSAKFLTLFVIFETLFFKVLFLAYAFVYTFFTCISLLFGCAGFSLPCRLSLVAASRGYPLGAVPWASHYSGFSCCGSWALEPPAFSTCIMWIQQLWYKGLVAHSMRNLPRQGIELVSPALAGRFLTTRQSGKSLVYSFQSQILL